MSKTTNKAAKTNKPTRYKQVIEKVFEACKVMGWHYELENQDKQEKFAIFKVSKHFDYNLVTGVLYVTVGENVEYSMQKTSFYSYGLSELMKAVTLKAEELDWLEKTSDKNKQPVTPRAEAIVSTILKNFDKSARQLKRRHDGRPGFVVVDEYDVQDLLHSILRAFFTDVRAEEHTPSYAGAASRVDFLIKDEKIIIEVKFAKPRLKSKEICNQIIIDIKRYQSHPECKNLFCLIYDPDGHIHNPGGIEKDLSKMHDELNVKVFVVPH